MKPPCDCIQKVNEKLEEQNAQLETAFDYTNSCAFLVIKTIKTIRHKRNKALPILPSYCPFCGKKYE